MIFHDRRHAGTVLAAQLSRYRGDPRAIVLALPRGGVPVAHHIAEELELPLDVFVVRALGVPGNTAMAMGAISSGGVLVLNRRVVAALDITAKDIEDAADRELAEIQEREAAYGVDDGRPDLAQKTVILVDDGLANGSTMLSAISALRKIEVAKIVVAVPVAAQDVCAVIESQVEEMIVARTPHPFRSVSSWYEDFAQVLDDEVRGLLLTARQHRAQIAGADLQPHS